MLKFVRFALAFAFGYSLVALGGGIGTPQFWICVGLFAAHSFIVALDAVNDYAKNN
jgi:hypothetical protein